MTTLHKLLGRSTACQKAEALPILVKPIAEDEFRQSLDPARSSKGL